MKLNPTCSPKETRLFIEECFNANLVPFIQSSPGCGKSSIIKQIAKDYSLKLIDIRLSTCAPEDLQGLPRFINNRAQFCPFDIFPLEGDPIPQGYEGFLIFLDEFNSAPRSVQAAAYRLILDREVGQYKLHPQCWLVAAGNLSTDKAITNNLSTAMQSRLVHIEMSVSLEDWMTDVALKENYDERIIAFINMYPHKLMDFDPERDEQTFACPRTWSFVNALIKGKKDITYLTPLLKGTISQGIAIEFTSFVNVYKSLVSLEDILKDPFNTEVPEDLASKWALITSLSQKANKANLEKISIYLDKFMNSFQVLFYRMLLAKDSSFITHPIFTKIATKISKYLNE